MGKDFRYYFQHPWSRMIVAYLVIFFNFLIFAEDPVSHSQTEANVIVVGNCFSFVTNKYPRGVGWRILKVLLWLLAILIGLIAGKFLFHQRLFGKYCTMCYHDAGTWLPVHSEPELSVSKIQCQLLAACPQGYMCPGLL